jgi:hypothetical protein
MAEPAKRSRALAQLQSIRNIPKNQKAARFARLFAGNLMG